MMKKTVYYIEDIYRPVDTPNEAFVLLNDYANDTYRLESVGFGGIIRNQRGDVWNEGNFVYYTPNENNYRVFRSANGSSTARQAYLYSNEFIDQHRNDEFQDEIPVQNYLPQNVVSVKSYHVNVGHGNCSIIAIQRKSGFEIWMIDCSTYEPFTKSQFRYENNLEAAINGLVSDLNIRKEDFHVSSFILTHKHFDHYCGLEYLIKHGYVDQRTVIYSNLYYICASSTFQRIQKLLQGYHIIEPSTCRPNDVIRFLNPEKPITLKGRLPKNAPKNHREVACANNSSIVTYIQISGKAMIFPGDLEDNDFKAMSSTPKCTPYLYKADYYCVSHHGSLNGHPQSNCGSANPRWTIANCIRTNKVKVILMGRDGSYKGIYDHNTVIPFWGNKLVYTEHDPQNKQIKYLTLDWKTGNVQYV